MCEHCRNIQIWRKFDAPKDYLACIAYIQQLVEQGEFELMAEESTCPLEEVKTEDGWADEIMAHMIRCSYPKTPKRFHLFSPPRSNWMRKRFIQLKITGLQ